MASRKRTSAFSIYSSNTSKMSTDSSSDDTSSSSDESEHLASTSKRQKKTVEKSTSITTSRRIISSDQENGVKGRNGKGPNKKRNRKRRSVPTRINESNKKDSDEHSTSEEESAMENEIRNPFAASSSLPAMKKMSCGNKVADEVFKWLLGPVYSENFFENFFEKDPLFIKRGKPNYYQGLFETKVFNQIIKENHLDYDKEIDVVKYVNGVRIPVEKELTVHPHHIWKAYAEGNSVRMRNPQAYHNPLWNLCSLLQEYFSSTVGANMYLTPPNSQGFPPHWDDIDAFILQIEGKKTWKVYKPRDDSEELPKNSSEDLHEDEIGDPCLVKEISAGDLLYIPRGYIHQAKATDEHSLHITISTNQTNTWSDLMQLGLTIALEKATVNDVEFRESLPKDYFDIVGQSFSQNKCTQRTAMIKKAKKLCCKILDNFSIDSAADAHAMDFIHGSMPPFFSKIEGNHSVHGNGHKFQNGEVQLVSELTPQSKIRWIRKRAFRLVVDEEGARLFHTLGNSKNSKEHEAEFASVEIEDISAVNALFQKHPSYIQIKDLPMEGGMEAKMEFAQVLYDNGFLVTENPLPLMTPE